MKVIAIAIADVHLSHQPPICRAGEPDWYATMAEVLQWVSLLGLEFDAPVLCAGDLFHRWNSPPSLINLALDHIRGEWWCVAGQHDLPMHNYSDINKSALATLSKSRINLLDPCYPFPSIPVVGFPWGFELRKAAHDETIAVVHRYAWKDRNTCYMNAPDEGHVKKLAEKLQGYKTVILGDNHISWEKKGRPFFYNCGSLMRRSSDQRDHHPSVGLVYDDGHVEREYLDISKDVFESVSITDESHEERAKGFVEGLISMADNSGEGFEAAIHRWIKDHKPNERVKKLLLESIE